MKIGSAAVLVAYAGTYGWGNRLITDEHGQVREGQQYMTNGYTDRDDAIRRAAHHAAQVAWTHDVDNDAAWLSLNRPQAIHITQWQPIARELVEYFAWQRRYRAAREKGHNDKEAHEIASSH